MIKTARIALPAATLFGLSACGIYHVREYQPNSFTSLRTEDAAAASTNCFESSTAAEKAACTVPSLAPLNRALTETLQKDLREADLFSRDALMAVQRNWLLGLNGACHLPATVDGALRADARQIARVADACPAGEDVAAFPLEHGWVDVGLAGQHA